MWRDPSLHAYSHQHQHALALCVRLDRALAAGAVDLPKWNAEIARAFATEIEFHFRAEEDFLFPAAAQHAELSPLVRELLDEHTRLLVFGRDAAEARLDSDSLRQFASALTSHVRREERELFEACQRVMPPEELQRVAMLTAHYFEANGINPNACALP